MDHRLQKIISAEFHKPISNKFVFILLIEFFLVFCGAYASEQEDEQYFGQFYQRLKQKYSHWNWDNSETYFSNVESKLSNFPIQEGVSISHVKVGDKCLIKEVDGIFKGNEISWKIDSSEFLQTESDITLQVNSRPLTLSPRVEKTPFLGKAESLETFLKALHQGFWCKTAVWSGNLSPSRDTKLYGRVEIIASYNQHHSLGVKAMALSYDSARHKTGIFFDIFDSENPLEFLPPISPDENRFEFLDHEKSILDTDFCFSVQGKKFHRHPRQHLLYKIFPNAETREKWTKGTNGFLKVDKKDVEIFKLVPGNIQLPTDYPYTTIQEDGKLEEIQPVYIPTRLDATHCFVRSTPERHASLYIYADGHGKFFPTAHYQERWTNSQNGDVVDVNYFEKTLPEVDLSTAIYGSGFRTWNLGVYKLETCDDSSEQLTWRQEGEISSEVLLYYSRKKALFSVLDASSLLTHYDNIKMCDAIAGINLPAIAAFSPLEHTLFKAGHKIASCMLSKVTLKQVSWNQVLEALGELPHLQFLDLSNNDFNKAHLKPIEDHLKKLTKLSTLKIQGQLFSPDDMPALCEVISRISSIEDLYIDNLPALAYAEWLWGDNKSEIADRTRQIERASAFISKLKNLKEFKIAYKNTSESHDFENLINRKLGRESKEAIPSLAFEIGRNNQTSSQNQTHQQLYKWGSVAGVGTAAITVAGFILVRNLKR